MLLPQARHRPMCFITTFMQFPTTELQLNCSQLHSEPLCPEHCQQSQPPVRANLSSAGTSETWGLNYRHFLVSAGASVNRDRSSSHLCCRLAAGTARGTGYMSNNNVFVLSFCVEMASTKPRVTPSPREAAPPSKAHLGALFQSHGRYPPVQVTLSHEKCTGERKATVFQPQ